MATPYSAFDYLCDEPYFVQGIGYLKCPTLKEMRKVTYNLFLYYVNILSCTHEDYLKMHNLQEKYNELSDADKGKNTLFFLLLYGNASLLFSMLSTFIVDEVVFDNKTLTFNIFKGDDDNKKQIGHIGNDNFEEFREQMQYILGTRPAEEKEQKFKNKLAQKMFDKLQKHAKEQKKSSDENYSFDNMIKKYCTHNKVGINILNVWDMTYYQFMQMFNEYCNGRQCDFNDMMAANTFSYKKSTDYKPLDYMKKLKIN